MSKKSTNFWVWVIIVVAVVLVFAWLSSTKEEEEVVVDEEFEARMRLLQQKKELETEQDILGRHNEKIVLIQAVLTEFANKVYKRIIFSLGILFVVWNLTLYFAFSDFNFDWVLGFNAFIALILIGIEFAIYRKVKGAQNRIKKEVKKIVYNKYFERRTPEFFADQKEMNMKRMLEIENEILEIDTKLENSF